ncbi:hypothetical protein PF005_g18244 [Phytophthora fragariae]|uniref:Uncharacterized protein n=1 Tax=Phytophthora fragariae TaxID=53985 RepID=A0A6A3X0W8_9STRA|nr:hypothetical protein PF003_g21720 [Phytophthora fragariae]KAE8930712.1 hypothetical protein PF009_g19204 [Phytophthora fragariae]KAE8993993.1 hypothetical protein PF011_g16915 [Phytophthora fragariae]KAE9093359.1 hypothetical protein PF007_g18152 [Phytophthora fragariae]KAE9093484.1 hypothetical protein PF010_g17472 [Phytophthora fragariae]
MTQICCAVATLYVAIHAFSPPSRTPRPCVPSPGSTQTALLYLYMYCIALQFAGASPLSCGG